MWTQRRSSWWKIYSYQCWCRDKEPTTIGFVSEWIKHQGWQVVSFIESTICGYKGHDWKEIPEYYDDVKDKRYIECQRCGALDKH